MPQKTGSSVIDDEGHMWYDDYLYMNGGAIFNFTLEAVPAMIKQVLDKNRMEKDNVDYYLFIRQINSCSILFAKCVHYQRINIM